MRRLLLISWTCLFTSNSFSQINLKTYQNLIEKGDSLFELKEYKNAAITYSLGLRMLGKKARVHDRISTVNSWVESNLNDSAFYQLEQISNSANLTFTEANLIVYNVPLDSDKRWQPIRDKLYLRAYKNFLSAQQQGVALKGLNQKQIEFALALSNNSREAYSHLNDRAYIFLKKKNYGKAYKLFKLSIDFFGPNAIVYQNMMDYYVATNDMDRAYVYFSRAQVLKYKNQSFLAGSVQTVDSAIKADYKTLSRLLRNDVHPPEYLNKMIGDAYMNKGMTEKAYTFFKNNVYLYPTSYTAIKDMGAFFSKTGNKKEADAYNQKSLILQYQLPPDFFHPAFDFKQFLIERTDSLSGKKGIKPMPPEPFIDDVANQFLLQGNYDKAEMLFHMNVENYLTSYYAHKSMAGFYKELNNKIKEEQYELEAQAAKEKYGTRRSRVFKDGPIADTTFDVSVSSPACWSNCPTILVDYAHRIRTIASLEHDFKSLFRLLKNDGFNFVKNYGYLTSQVLANIDVVFLKGGEFENDEIQLLNNWVRQGGALLTFTHHDWPLFDPVLQSFGIRTEEIEFTVDSLHGLLRDHFTNNSQYIYFSEEDSALGNHIILKGRSAAEKVRRVETFASKSIIGPPGSSVLLKLSPSAVDLMSIDPPSVAARVPVKTSGTRSLGIAFTYGKGKVVVTDSWALMALLFDNSERGKMGMNTPGNDNKQYALNIMRWLTGYLK